MPGFGLNTWSNVVLELCPRDFAGSVERTIKKFIVQVGGGEKDVTPLPGKPVDAGDGGDGDGDVAGNGVFPACHQKLGAGVNTRPVGVDDVHTVTVRAGPVNLSCALRLHGGEEDFIPAPLTHAARDKATIENGRDALLSGGVVEKVSSIIHAEGKLLGIDLFVGIPSG
jgi:hypothetical protein